MNEQDVATEIQGFGLNLFHGHVAGLFTIFEVK